MTRTILIDVKKREARAKEAQIELCYKQREEQIRKYESRNPFSYHEWNAAFLNGSLRQHGLGYWSFPSPVAHYRKLWEESDEEWFASWRAESKRKHKKWKRSRRKK